MTSTLDRVTGSTSSSSTSLSCLSILHLWVIWGQASIIKPLPTPRLQASQHQLDTSANARGNDEDKAWKMDWLRLKRWNATNRASISNLIMGTAIQTYVISHDWYCFSILNAQSYYVKMHCPLHNLRLWNWIKGVAFKLPQIKCKRTRVNGKCHFDAMLNMNVVVMECEYTHRVWQYFVPWFVRIVLLLQVALVTL